MSNIHVYAIGGCHLTDYIVGKHKSFLEISMKTSKLDYVIDNIISPATVFSGKNKIKKVYLENYPDTLLIISTWQL